MGGFRVSAMATTLVTVFLLLMINTASADNKIRCYQFTWAGDNNETDCEDHAIDQDENPIPCKSPIVYTVPRYLPPDLDDLEDHCSRYECPQYWCDTNNQICIRWAWFDVNDKIYNYTTFCGTVADVTSLDSKGAVPVTNGCWTARLGTFTKEVCACDTEDKCNSSSSVLASLTLVSLISVCMHLLWNNDIIF